MLENQDRWLQKFRKGVVNQQTEFVLVGPYAIDSMMLKKNIDPKMFTRKWFAWANTMFGELMVYLYNNKPHLLKLKLV